MIRMDQLIGDLNLDSSLGRIGSDHERVRSLVQWESMGD
jgi:hypothetical protein